MNLYIIHANPTDHFKRKKCVVNKTQKTNGGWDFVTCHATSMTLDFGEFSIPNTLIFNFQKTKKNKKPANI